jgi:hypothetical protein
LLLEILSTKSGRAQISIVGLSDLEAVEYLQGTPGWM